MNNDTIFGKIIRGEIPCDKVYEDELLLAFRDINPAAPTHILIIPKKAIPRVADAVDDDALLLGKLMLKAAEIARSEGIAEDGYRLVVNCNAHGGQTVYHLHMHLLGGRALGWPPG
jgi:histidine triad (HIT) family protein